MNVVVGIFRRLFSNLSSAIEDTVNIDNQPKNKVTTEEEEEEKQHQSFNESTPSNAACKKE